MIISKAQVQDLLKIYNKTDGGNKLDKSQVSKSKAAGDELNISETSKLKQRALMAVKQADDIRADRVKDLEERVSSGTYSVSDGEIAEKMIERAIVDRLV